MGIPKPSLILICLTLSGLDSGRLPARGLDHVSPARASLAGGEVIVRSVSLPTAPFPGIAPNPYAPVTEPGEHRMHFRAGDIQAFHPDGTAVAPATWQAALTQETSVLFLGHALVDPNTGTPATRPGVTLSPEEKSIYKPDALVLFGTRSPVRQQPVPHAKPAKGVQPRFGTVLVEPNGMIRVTERLDLRSHFYAPLPTGGQTHIFQNTTTTTTRSLPYGDVRVWTSDGRRIAANVLPQWLTQEYPALISGDGGEVDPLFLDLLKPNTPVVAVPTQATGPRPGAPASAPVAPAPPR